MNFRKGIYSVLSVAVIAGGAMMSGCSKQYSRLDNVLAIAGDNRGELERVLEHYADDSLKLAAARYLIENMAGHYSIADVEKADLIYASLDSLVQSMAGADNTTIADSIKALCARHQYDMLRKLPDLKVITADFLISNIDGAFRQWRELPWNKHLTFDQFCEYLLPYKVNEYQALDDWRTAYTPMFADSLERLQSCSLFRISSFQAAEAVNNTLWEQFDIECKEYGIPQLYYRTLTRLRIPFGTCDELCRPGVAMLRAAGVPVAMDHVPVWGYGNRGHSWAVVLGPNGKDIPFVPMHTSPCTQHKINETIAKVYRYTYAINDGLLELNNSGVWVPQTFRNIFQRDITPQYTMTRDLEFETCDSDAPYVYLCTSSRAGWKPVAYARNEMGKAKFEDVGVGCIYMLYAYDKEGTEIALSAPLKVDRDGSCSYLYPDFEKRRDVTLYRKAPLLEYAWTMAVEVEKGEFEASDDADFRNAVAVGKVQTKADRAGEIRVGDSAGKHRYWRYIVRNGADTARCYIGEVTFFSGDSIINSKGRPVGTYDSNNGIHEDAARAFDGDVLTDFSVRRKCEAWVGLDFGKPVGVDMIRYSPRSDGNMIEPGDEYELKYWADGGWKSLGTKIADTVCIDFEGVPSGALYVLLNNTKGNSVRVFLLDDDGRQEWW